MRYNSRRNYLYPVLRPFSDDYPEGKLTTALQVEITGKAVNVSVSFDVAEASIQSQIFQGDAVCVAMLYCGSTLYREMLRAGTGSTRVETSISTDFLHGHVELHPSIVAANDLTYPSATAHQEYSSAPVSVAQWNPLATDQQWHFQVNPSARPAKGIFNREVDDELADGEFDVKCDTTAKYVNVMANSATMTKFKELSSDERRTLPTVYISALVSALAEVKEMDSEANIHEDGWVSCIQTNMKRLGIDIGDQEGQGSHTLFRAAQLLLSKPFHQYLTMAFQERSSDEEEE